MKPESPPLPTPSPSGGRKSSRLAEAQAAPPASVLGGTAPPAPGARLGTPGRKTPIPGEPIGGRNGGEKASPSGSEAARRERERLRGRRRRAAAKAEREAAAVAVEASAAVPVLGRGRSPSAALARWSKERLRVPVGPLAGSPFIIRPWQVRFLRGALRPGIREAGLSVARKNGKSGLIAALILGYLVGPLNRPGWRGAVVSLTARLAQELRDAIAGIVTASGIEGVDLKRLIIRGHRGASVEFLAADRATGHALGLDLAVVDEAGLLLERDRPLWNAMLSSTSGRDGRLVCISIRGEGPMFDEMARRADDPAVFWTEHAAPESASLDDPKAWAAANPGLADGIKSRRYMVDAARRARTIPADAPSFRAYDLNLPQEPSREMILSVRQWMECVVDRLPARSGDCLLGWDLGGSASMTAAVAYWPTTGRMEAWGAFPSNPDLRERGDADGVGGLYIQMRERGELVLYPGRVTDVRRFLEDTANRLAGERIVAAAADRHRKEEAQDALQAVGVNWPMQWRGIGKSHTADGSADVRAFQREVLSGHVATVRSLLMESAIAASSIERDSSGNPKLEKASSRGRIDALQAAVLALGLGARWRSRPKRRAYHGMA